MCIRDSTYTSEEGVDVSFEAKMTVKAAKDDAQNGNGQDDQKTDTGNTSDPTADDQNKGDETPADSTTDPSNDANTSDGGNNGNTTTEVTLAVDEMCIRDRYIPLLHQQSYQYHYR